MAIKASEVLKVGARSPVSCEKPGSKQFQDNADHASSVALSALRDSPPMASTARQTRRRDPVAVACRLHDRALACRAQGRPQKAEPLCRQALHLLEETVGPDHPDVANVLNTLGSIHLDQAA